ncbi:MAG: CPBP family intramembrane metalloprotease [Bacteroidales bacterium]|nr:CPBP family intramembrane metalloprotease [Bacteroidales bacterium]
MSDSFSRYRDFVMSSSPWYKLLFVFFLILVFFLLTGIIGLITVMITFKMSLLEVTSVLNNPDIADIHVIKLLQVIQTIGIFIIPAFIGAFFLGPRIIPYLKMDTYPSLITVVLVICLMIICIPAINFLAGFNARLDLPASMDAIETTIDKLRDNYNELTNMFLSTTTVNDFLANIAIMAVLPAIGEELLFRGVFQRLFAEWTRNIHWGIIISSLLFSFFHLEFYGFLPRFMLGILFGYLFVWTASIWIPMLAHFTNNVVIVGYYFFIQPATGVSKLDELGTRADLSLWISLGGGIILSVLVFYIARSRRFYSS